MGYAFVCQVVADLHAAAVRVPFQAPFVQLRVNLSRAGFRAEQV